MKLLTKVPAAAMLWVLLLTGCHPDKLNVDISDIETKPVEVMRFEKELFALNYQDFDKQSAELKSRYGNWYEYYLYSFLVKNGSSDTGYKKAVLNFVTDRNVSDCYKEVEKVFPSQALDELEPEFNNCMKRFHYHFPKKRLPEKLITCVSGWNYAFAYAEGNMTVALDMYLGDTSRFYGMLRYPHYMTRKMNSEYILPDIARGWMLTEFDNSEASGMLLDHIIFYGKIYYAVKALLPEAADSVVIGYTDPQMDYCKRYEKNLWGYFAEKNRLYDTNLDALRELTSEGPFTGAISKECPPRIGMWVGWQIVNSYMSNNPDVSLSQLMDEKDAKLILNKSRYRP